MECVMPVLTSVISCIATITIAIYAWLNYKLIKKIQFFNVNMAEFNDNNRREMATSNATSHRELTDILRAVVISNLLANKKTAEELTSSINIFNTEYFGTTQIFASEANKMR